MLFYLKEYSCKRHLLLFSDEFFHIKIDPQTAIYAICRSILCIKKVAANRKIGCLMLGFSMNFDQQKAKRLFVDGISKNQDSE